MIIKDEKERQRLYNKIRDLLDNSYDYTLNKVDTKLKGMFATDFSSIKELRALYSSLLKLDKEVIKFEKKCEKIFKRYYS